MGPKTPSLRVYGAPALRSLLNGQATNPLNSLVSLLSRTGHKLCHATLKEVGSSSTLACHPTTLDYRRDTLVMGMDQGVPAKG